MILVVEINFFSYCLENRVHNPPSLLRRPLNLRGEHLPAGRQGGGGTGGTPFSSFEGDEPVMKDSVAFTLFPTPGNCRILNRPHGPILGVDNDLIPFLCLEQYGREVLGITFLIKSNAS